MSIQSALDKRRKAKDQRLQREYGITLEQYEKILAYQNDCCAICKRPAWSMKMSLAVDHCHTSGLIRGLLCMQCNRALGKFQDSIVKLREAVAYLEKPPVTSALGMTIISAPGRVGTRKRMKLLTKLTREKGDNTKGKTRRKQACVR